MREQVPIYENVARARLPRVARVGNFLSNWLRYSTNLIYTKADLTPSGYRMIRWIAAHGLCVTTKDASGFEYFELDLKTRLWAEGLI